MKARLFLATMVCCGLLLVLGVMLAEAQEPLPEAQAAALSPLSSAFTYQGRLLLSGNPVNGTCDLQFGLWDAETGGAQIGATQTKTSVSVHDGLFTVLLDYGAAAFAGEARWLEIAVRSPAGSGAYTVLSPRQALTAVPYALYAKAMPWGGVAGMPAGFADGVDNDTLYSAGAGLVLLGNSFQVMTSTIQQRVSGACGAGYAIRQVNADGTVLCEPVVGGAGQYWSLTGNAGTVSATHFLGTTDAQALDIRVNNARALRLEPNAISPNIIGGYSGNTVASGRLGATIAGGGTGGAINQVSGDFGTIGGGLNNIVSGDYATLAGGDLNEASGGLAVIGGGGSNLATAEFATVAGGGDNEASGARATVGGGWRNKATAGVATVGGGSENTATAGSATVGGGVMNRATGAGAAVGGGATNTAAGAWSSIAGGDNNWAEHDYATVGGGYQNAARGDYSTISGGDDNRAGGQHASIGGGYYNIANAEQSTIGGGAWNRVWAVTATIGGGEYINVEGMGATVAGGSHISVTGAYATVAGGQYNTATGGLATIGGGGGWHREDEIFTLFGNVASGARATVGGGGGNTASGYHSTVAGGVGNTASGDGAFVGGGGSFDWYGYDLGNTASGYYATVGGGIGNRAEGEGSVVGGGGGLDPHDARFSNLGNIAGGRWATIGGGRENTTKSDWATIGGGEHISVTGQAATVAGGSWITATGDYAAVGGGRYNRANGPNATVGGGLNNTANGYYVTVGGGSNNKAFGYIGTVGGGHGNTASGESATVAGGDTNTASGDFATVGGGGANTASGYLAMVPGGDRNSAAGQVSFAAGRRAKANSLGCFVWGDATDADITCTTPNRWVARTTGGAVFWSNTALTTGVIMYTGGGSWSNASDRALKENFRVVDGREVLTRLATVPVMSWNYKSQDTAIRHMGPVSQDFYAAFGLGEDEKTISTVDAEGVSLAAIQGLYELSQEQAGRIEELEAENASLEGRLVALEAAMAKLLQQQTGDRP